jgi:uncharacterized protein (DUF488 family)
MRLYTIGFTQKRAEQFFNAIREAGVVRLIDIRQNPGGQLSGFAKQEDLPYFLTHLAGGCEYVHRLDLAPTKEMLSEYRSAPDWDRYEVQFEALMDERRIPHTLDPALFDRAVLLCSEATPEQCHRRLVAERLAKHWRDVEIVHL